MRKICSYIFVLLVAAVMLFSPSCGKEEPFDLLVSIRPSQTVIPGETVVKYNYVNGKGPKSDDLVVLESLSPGGPVFTYAIKDLAETWFTFLVGSDFVEGRYNLCIERKGKRKILGEVSFSIQAVEDGFTPQAGMTAYGRVTCGEKGIAGAVVSDGYEVVATDSEGYWQMRSEKKTGYVFLSVPSGYEVMSVGVLPQLYKTFKLASGALERVDFELFEAGDQSKHKVLVFGDMHMANRTNDRAQFGKFTKEINEYLSSQSEDKVYAITLGDMTWDLYWYTNSYCFEQYLIDVNTIKGLQIFHSIGNHDHDMNATGDWDTVLRFRQALCPNYYSFNIGGVHYISLDDIECTNATASTSDGSVRKYNTKVVPEIIEWLKKDLSFVSKDTPVVTFMHSCVFDQNGSNALINAAELTACYSAFDYVLFETGHSHKVWNVDKGKLHENNTGAVCAAWWWSGKYQPDLNLAQDGVPGGYRILDVNGKSITSRFKATCHPDARQFWAYDRNSVLITPEKCGVTKEANKEIFTEYLKSRGDYGTASASNEILINVWDYNSSWTVEVYEDGKKLSVSQIAAYDPLFFLTYIGPRFAESTSVSWAPFNTRHMFKATASSATSTIVIKVTDDEGRLYSETMKRPKEFSVNAYK